MISLNPLLRILLEVSKQLVSRCCEVKASWLDRLVLLARPLKAANPDAKHPGKAGNNPRGKSTFPPGIIPRLSMGQKSPSFAVPKKQAKILVFSNIILPPDGVQGPKALGSGVQGDEPPMTACDGNFIGGEISRNKQSPKELCRLRLRIEEAPCPVSSADLYIHNKVSRRKTMAKKESVKKDLKLDNTQQEKMKALEATLSSIEKEFGKGTVMKLGEKTAMQVDVVPTGCLDLDMALGVGGIPRGRIIEVFGPESSGKTTVALHVVAQVQKRGGAAAFIDAEHALDPAYAKNLGVNIDELYVSQPNCGEDALEIAEALLRSGAIDIVVIDSVAALVPRAEIDGEMGDSFVGIQARLMSQAMRKLTGVVAKTNAIALFINQIREKVGVMYGNPETTPGGRALKFYASVRLDVRRGEQLKNGSDVIGNRTKVKVVKNKVAPPFRSCEFDLIYGQGISREGSLLDMAVAKDIIVKSGAWFSYNDQRIAQGRDNARQYLKDHPDIADEIDALLRQQMAQMTVPAVDESDIPEMDPDMGDGDEA